MDPIGIQPGHDSMIRWPWSDHKQHRLDQELDELIRQYTLWLFNIAMENPNHKWRFLAGKIIYKWTIYSMAMLNNQRVQFKTQVGCVFGLSGILSRDI